MARSERRLRVLQLTESASAGVGRHVLDLASALLDREHEVHLLYSPNRSDETFRRRVNSLRGHSSFHVFEIPMRRGPHWTDVPAVLKIRKYTRAHAPFDVAHLHSSKAGLVGRLALMGTTFRRIYTPHALFTLGHSGIWRLLGATAERLLGCLCETIILVSRAELDHAVSIGLPGRRLRVVNPGVALAEPRQAGGRSHEVRIGFVGRLVVQKSPETLLRAAQILSKDPTCSVRFGIVGDGPLLPKLVELSRDLGIADRLDWLGPADGAAAMRTFDVLALTSRYEGFPYVILEAMSQGLPVVATRVGGTADTVHEGENGFLAAIGDVEEVARALSTLAHDAALRRRMGAASQRIVKQFSLDRMVDQTIAAYRDPLGTNPTQAFPASIEELDRSVRG